MPFFKWTEMEEGFITPEYSSAHGPNIKAETLEVGLFSYPAGTEAKPHAHPNEQIMIVLKGKMRMRIGTEEKDMGPGEACLMPPDIEHRLQALEDLQIVNCKGVVPGWSVYHAKWEK